MKKKILITIFFFSVLFIAFSEVLLSHSIKEMPFFKQIIVILCLSAAATIIGVLLLFYRKSRPVQVGVISGILATLVSSGWFSVLWFLLAGGAPVYLGKHEIRNYRESAFMALETGVILFLTHYVFNAVMSYSGIIGERVVEDITEVTRNTIMGLGVLIGLQVFILCLLSVLGGLITYMALKAARMIREEDKQKKEQKKNKNEGSNRSI